MKYKVAICDDETSTCSEFEKMTEHVFEELGLQVEIDIFYSGEGFLDYLYNGHEYNFILLDIELQKKNGVEVGKSIRNVICDYKSQIIYISSKTMYAMELFQVQPLDFLVKPVEKEKLKQVLSRGIKILNTVQECFEISVGQKSIRIPYNDILFFESSGRKVKIITLKNDEIFYEKLSTIKKQLPSFFLQVHKSFIVNMNCVRTCGYEKMIMSNGVYISISRTYRNEVRQKYLERRFG